MALRRTPPSVSREETPVGHLAARARAGDAQARAYFAAHQVTAEEVARECDLEARDCLRAIRVAQDLRRYDA